MANLGFRTILAHGDIWLGEKMGEKGADRFDWFSFRFNLPGFQDLPALLVVATMKVDFEKSFITVNAPTKGPDDVRNQSYDDAKDKDYFVSRILPNPSNTWILQIHRVPPGVLVPKGYSAGDKINRIGIHTRTVDGKPVENRDNFGVARIFLFYFGSQ